MQDVVIQKLPDGKARHPVCRQARSLVSVRNPICARNLHTFLPGSHAGICQLPRHTAKPNTTRGALDSGAIDIDVAQRDPSGWRRGCGASGGTVLRLCLLLRTSRACSFVVTTFRRCAVVQQFPQSGGLDVQLGGSRAMPR